jgi:hypothetical protein
MAWDNQQDLCLIGGPGVGVYNAASRRWDSVLSRSSGQLDLADVSDLEFASPNALIVAGRNGVNALRWSRGQPVKLSHANKASGLAGDNIKTIQPIRHIGRPTSTDVTYQTEKDALGYVRVNLTSGDISDMRTLIAESRAQGLSRDALVRADADPKHEGLWMMYRQPQAREMMLAAFYQTPEHHMRGVTPSDAWHESGQATLVPDDYTDNPTAWVGGKGLRELTARRDDAIDITKAGLANVTVNEVVPTPTTIFARVRATNTSLPMCLRAALRQQPAHQGARDWSYQIGPRRFPGVTLGDITAAAEGTYGQQPALFFGTLDKSIAAFTYDSREFFQAYVSNDANEAGPARGSLDIYALGSKLVQVGSDRSLRLYNGSSWSTVIPDSGIRMDPDEATVMGAQANHLFIGSDSQIGYYNAKTHHWYTIPFDAELERLIVAIDRLWAISKTRVLYSCSLTEAISPNATVSDVWTQEEPSVVDIHGDDQTIAVIANDKDTYRLWVQTAGQTDRRTIVTTTGLPGDSQTWSAAAVEGTRLYIAPHEGKIGQYDILTHTWTDIVPPSSSNTSVTKLVATPTGLWLLNGLRDLYFLAKGSLDWKQAASHVNRLNSNGECVLALTEKGQVLLSHPSSGDLPMTTLVGDAFQDSLQNVQAAVVFKNRLFIATPQRAGRYDTERHSWHTYSASQFSGIVEFAYSENLYARAQEGTVWRWSPDEDTFNRVNTADGQAVKAKRISGSGGSMIVVHMQDGRVLALVDDEGEHPKTVLAATRCPIHPPFAVGAQIGQDLMLASKQGEMATYGKIPNQPFKWYPVNVTLPDPRQLLVSSGNDDRAVIVNNSKASLLKRSNDSGRWTHEHYLVTSATDLQGALSDSDFYGLAQGNHSGKSVFKVPLDQPSQSSSGTPIHTMIIGAPFPGEPRSMTRAVGSDSTGRLFRSDQLGRVGQYDFSTHSWKSETFEGVDEFYLIQDTLWAWCPAQGDLYRFRTSAWEVDTSNLAHVHGDTHGMVLAFQDGRISMRTGNRDQTLIPALKEILPIDTTDQLSALAECGNRLFVATQDGSLLSYQRQAHTWDVYTNIPRIKDFKRLSQGKEAVFALTSNSELLHYNESTNTGSRALTNEGSIRAWTADAGHLAVVTEKGDVVLVNSEADIVAAHRPGAIDKVDVNDMHITAAAEMAGKLVVILGGPRVDAQVWIYNPDNHLWTSCKIEGQPERFYQTARDLWVAALQPDHTYTLSRMDTGTLNIGSSIGDLLDITCDEKRVIVVTDQGQVRELNSDGSLNSVGVAESALPEGHEVQKAIALAHVSVVLLDDGSIYHYNMEERQWRQQFSPSASGKAGSLYSIGEGCGAVLWRPNGDTWHGDAKTATWRQLDPNDNLAISVPVKSAWTINGKRQDYTFIYDTGTRQLKMELQAGRLDIDRAQKVALEADSLHVKTSVGTRTFRMKRGAWQEEDTIALEFTHSKPDPVKFKGKLFALQPDQAQGDFTTISGTMRMTLLTDGASAHLVQAMGKKGLMFAHDVIRDVAIDGSEVWLATAGGIVRMELQGSDLKLRRIYEESCGLPDLDVTRILCDDRRLRISTEQGKYYECFKNKHQWNEARRSEVISTFVGRSAITRCNDMLSHWAVQQDNDKIKLCMLVSGRQIPVSLTDIGFGFDHPRAFGLSAEKIRLYTPDGLLEIDRTTAGSWLETLDPRYALPAFEGYAKTLESLQGSRTKDIWIRTLKKDQVWRYDQRQWLRGTLKAFDTALKGEHPYFLDSPALRWDHYDQVTMIPGRGQADMLIMQFDADLGRFDLDMPFDLSVYHNALWIITKGGVVRFASDGQWDHVTRWNPHLTPATHESSLYTMTVDRTPALIIEAKNRIIQWNGQRWVSPANATRLQQLIEQKQAHLVDDTVWRVEHTEAQAYPTRMEARFVPGQDPFTVMLDNEGLFDFERVNSVLDDGDGCHIACQMGLTRMDVQSCEFISLKRQGSPGVLLGRLDDQIYTRLASGDTLVYRGQWSPYSMSDDVFARMAQRIVKQSYWEWQRINNKLNITILPGSGSLWAGSEPFGVNTSQGRFGFDTVRDVGYANSPWLITEAGLIPRVGPAHHRIGKPESPTGNKVPDSATLQNVVLEDTPTLVLQTSDQCYFVQNNSFRPVPSIQIEEIRTILAEQVARNPIYSINRTRARRLNTSIRINRESSQYKTIEFDKEAGRFSFDVMTSIGSYCGDVNNVLLLGTHGGVAIYDKNVSTTRRADRIGHLCHLYCTPDDDGLGTVKIEKVAYAKNAMTNFALLGQSELYRLNESGNANSPYGRWERARSSDVTLYARSQQVVADDPRGWKIADRHRTLGTVTPREKKRFEVRWCDQTVHMLNLKTTSDSDTSICRFAHDVPLSASLTESNLWVGTRGGVVRFKTDPLGRVDPMEFDIRGEQTLHADELRGLKTPLGIGFIRTGKQGTHIYARRERDRVVLRCPVNNQGTQWQPVPQDEPGFRSCCQATSEPTLMWRKDSIEPAQFTYDKERIRVTSDYQFLQNGTWAFLDIDHVMVQDPHHSAVFYQNELYVATTGGITRFSTEDGIGYGVSRSSAGNHGFVAGVDARAMGASGWEPLEDVTELFVDHKEGTLFAKTRKGKHYVLDKTNNAWSVYQNPDNPFDRSLVLVDNDLLQWRLEADGTFDIHIVPLDIRDQSQYPLFHNGRFVFDNVHTFATDGKYYWLATDGGMCQYTYADFKPHTFHAKAFISTGAGVTGHVALARLPQVREIVKDPQNNTRLMSRTSSGTIFEYVNDGWQLNQDSEVFLNAYTRHIDGLIRWLEFPNRRLSLYLNTTTSQKVILGSGTRPNLFKNNRFAFDDVQDALLQGNTLLTVTSMGIVEQSVQWADQRVCFRGFHCFTDRIPGSPQMLDLEHIIRFPTGQVLAWGERAFVGDLTSGANQVWQWEVNSNNTQQFMSQMTYADVTELWKLRASSKSDPIKVESLRSGGMSHTIASRFKCNDVSRAAIDEKWIYLAAQNPGGLIRIRKADLY